MLMDFLLFFNFASKILWSRKFSIFRSVKFSIFWSVKIPKFFENHEIFSKNHEISFGYILCKNISTILFCFLIDRSRWDLFKNTLIYPYPIFYVFQKIVKLFYFPPPFFHFFFFFPFCRKFCRKFSRFWRTCIFCCTHSQKEYLKLII